MNVIRSQIVCTLKRYNTKKGIKWIKERLGKKRIETQWKSIISVKKIDYNFVFITLFQLVMYMYGAWFIHLVSFVCCFIFFIESFLCLLLQFFNMPSVRQLTPWITIIINKKRTKMVSQCWSINISHIYFYFFDFSQILVSR